MRPFLALHVLLMGALALAGVALLWLGLYEPDTTQGVIALGCGGGVAALTVYARYALGVGWGSAPMVYLALFWMFHYGLASTAVVVPAVLDSYRGWDVAWLYWPSTRAAMLLGLLGATGFVAGLGIVTLGGRDARQEAPTAPRVHDSALYWVGWAILLASLATAWGVLATNGGIGVLSLGYLEFRTTILTTTNFQTAIDGSQFGCLLALCGAGGRRWIAPLAVWMPLGAVMLLLGLRTEALLPLVSFTIVLMHRGVRFRRGALIAAVLAAVVVIPAIKTFRQVGFNNREDVNWTVLSPLATFTEMGGTLRATKAYVDWIDGGENRLWGASYWAPIDRQLLVRVIPGRERIPAAKDPRVPARNIAEREGSVGGSSTGEAYYNFGALGPLIFYACIGALFGWLQRRADVSAYGCALLAIAMVLLYFNIRAPWLAVPGRTAVALGVLGSCRAIGWLRGRSARLAMESAACS